MKKVLRLALCFVLVITLVVGICLTTGVAAKKEPLVLTMFSPDPNPDDTGFTDPVAKKITEITGIKLKFDYPVNDDKSKIALMIASGEYPDLIFQKGASDYVNAKALIDLTPYINKHGKNIKKLYGPYLKRLRYSLQDKSIYYLGCFGVGSETWDVSGVELQHAVVKELGYPRLKTVKDYENAIKAYKEKHPTIDGKPTIGLSLMGSDWRLMITVTNQAAFATGAPDDGEYYIDPKTYKAVLHHTRPEEKEYFRWLNHMNDIGLLDPESFVQQYDQYQAKIAEGRVLAIMDAKWDYSQAEQALRKAGKFERTYGNYPIVLNEKYKRAELQDTGYSGAWGVGISTKCKHKLEAFKFLDWMASDEAQVLNNWGIKDVNYKVVNGKRVIPPAELDRRNNDPLYRRKTGIGMYVYPFPQRGDGVLDSTGNTYTTLTPEFIKNRYSEVEKEVLAGYGVKMWKDLFPQKNEFPVKPWGVAYQIPTPDTNYNVIYQKCQDIIKKRIPEAILTKPEKFDAVWDTFMKELEQAGVHKMEAYYTGLIKDRIKLWNE